MPRTMIPLMSKTFAVLRIQSEKSEWKPTSYLQALPHAVDHNSKRGGYGVFKMNQGDRVACILASIDKSIECIGIVIARRICKLLQLWEKVVGGV